MVASVVRMMLDVGRCDDDLTEKKHSYVQLYVATCTYAPADIRYPASSQAENHTCTVPLGTRN